MPLDDDRLVEAMARALFTAAAFHGGYTWDEKWPDEGLRSGWLSQARAALAIARPRVLEEAARMADDSRLTWLAMAVDRHGLEREICRDRAKDAGDLASRIRGLAVEPGQSCASCGETGTAHKRTCSQWVGPGGFAASTAATAQLGQGIPGPHVPPPAILPAAPTAQDTSEPLVPCSVCGTPAPMPRMFRVYCGTACADKDSKGMWRAP